MSDFKKILTNMLPKKAKDVSIGILCIQEIYEYMLFDKGRVANVFELCEYSVKSAKKKDFDTLMEAMEFIRIKLFDVSNNAQLARRKLDILLNKIDDMAPNR